MARSRTWNLRLNLDLFNAALAALVDDAEKVQFLGGLSLGMNGGALRPNSPPAVGEGYTLGVGMRQEAETYRENRVEIGKLGGRPKEPHGLPHGLPDGSLDVNHMGTLESTSSEPNPQSTILNPLTPNPPEPLVPPQEGLKAKTRSSWRDLFAGKGDALEWFEKMINHRNATIESRAKVGAWKSEPPSFRPTKDASAFLKLVNAGKDARTLANAYAIYLDKDDKVIRGYVQALETFYGPRESTWEAYYPKAQAAMLKKPVPPPVPAPAQPQVPVDLLASAGFALPLPLTL